MHSEPSWDFLTAATIDTEVNRLATPLFESHGFESVGRRRWVRSREPIREMYCLTSRKGASLAPVWGFSLDFVPHVSGSRVTWHRTSKSARFDLSFNPTDYERSTSHIGVPHCHGLQYFVRSLNDVLSATIPKAESFWAAVQDVESDLLRAFEDKRSRTFVRLGFYNYPQEVLAFAFCLARLGQSTHARREFAKFLDCTNPSDSLRKRLNSVFEDAVSGSRPVA